MNKKHANPILLKNVLHTWQFWLICLASLMYFIDVLLQWFILKLPFDLYLSVVICIIFGVEAYIRLKHRKSYLGQRYAVYASIIAILGLIAYYAVK